MRSTKFETIPNDKKTNDQNNPYARFNCCASVCVIKKLDIRIRSLRLSVSYFDIHISSLFSAIKNTKIMAKILQYGINVKLFRNIMT